MCPNNLIGTVDLYLTTHHGLFQSNSKAIVDALHPRVAIMNNGATQRRESRGLADRSRLSRAAGFVAVALFRGRRRTRTTWRKNSSPIPTRRSDPGNYIMVLAQPNGTFTVVNSRNQFQKTYTK